MRYLVLGGTGLIGSHLVDTLAADGCAVRVFARGRTTMPAWQRPPGVDFMAGDFSDAGSVERALHGCSVVFHLVCTTLPKSSNENPARDVESNVVSTIRLLDLSRSSGVRRIVFVSSGGTVYGEAHQIPTPEGHPTSPQCSYGITKLAVEKYLELYATLHGIEYCVLRVANAYGERQRTATSQGAVAALLERAVAGETFEIWGDGSVTRDYVHVRDIAGALMKAARYGGSRGIFNIGTGHGTTLNDLVALVERVGGREVKVARKPGRAFDVRDSVLDIAQAQARLGWTPQISLEEGVRRTMEWMKSRPAYPTR